jgi:hypothetical protein
MQYVTLDQLAARLGVERSNARKIARSLGEPLGIAPVRRQVNGVGRDQRILTWTQEQATEIIKERVRLGFSVERGR